MDRRLCFPACTGDEFAHELPAQLLCYLTDFKLLLRLPHSLLATVLTVSFYQLLFSAQTSANSGVIALTHSLTHSGSLSTPSLDLLVSELE